MNMFLQSTSGIAPAKIASYGMPVDKLFLSVA